MSTGETRRHAWTAAGCAFALAALTAGSALAALPGTTAYYFSSRPLISGTVTTVNDHQMVVTTDQGELVTLEMDSRTMAPRDLAPGMVMRAEFIAQENCRFYAQRITPIRDGMSTDRLQAYANTHDTPEAVAKSMAMPGRYHDAGMTMMPAATMQREDVPQTMTEHSPGPSVKATPSTVDYLFSTHPSISGTVVSLNDHQMVVETRQGQHVGLVMDSRTMVPGDITPGTPVRAEFAPMRDGRYYANRVTRKAEASADREQSYAHTRDSDMVIAQNTTDCNCMAVTTASAPMSSMERRDPAAQPVAVQSEPVPVVERPDVLPQTASNQPLLLVAGLLALGAAGVVAAVRGSRIG